MTEQKLTEQEQELLRFPPEWDVYFEFLDELRESGRINMHDAHIPLQEEFPLSYRDAMDVLVRWMDTFHLRHPQEG